MPMEGEDHEHGPEDEVEHVIDLRTPTQSAAGVFAVSAKGAATRIPLRADEYRELVGHSAD
jgi:hypothetical protein